jgi:hypothetical protein
VAGFEATPDVWTTLDVAHPPGLGLARVAYLVTKNLAAARRSRRRSWAGWGCATAALGFWDRSCSRCSSSR